MTDAPAKPRVESDLGFAFVERGHARVDGCLLVRQLELGEFEHLDRVHVIGFDDPDWRLGVRTVDRLWTVTLHYHEWAYRLAQIAVGHDSIDVRRRALACLMHYLERWVAGCTCGESLAWNSYAIATRIGWWVRMYALIQDSARADIRGGESRLLHSLWIQAEHLSQRIEWDLRANHVIRDAVGLAWAGRFFVGDRPQKWLRKAEQIASSQVVEQVLRDGGHFERSAMYHVHVMEDLVTLFRLVEDQGLKGDIKRTLGRMAEFLRWARHPDGGYCLFNDAALNGAVAPNELLDQVAANLGLEVEVAPCEAGRYFDQYGLVIWHDEEWSLFFDVGSISVDYQPGHAHADSLSLEVSYRGRRVFVDPGTFAYDNDVRRRYDRSTAAHNTVCIDDEDSSEVWSIFRVGRRARILACDVSIDDQGMRAAAEHDGYRFLPGGPIHRRVVSVGRSGSVEIGDELTGKRSHLVSAGLLLEPAWVAEQASDGWIVRHEEGDRLKVVVQGPEGVELSINDALYHPRFHQEIATKRLVWRYQGVLPLRVTTMVTPA